MSPRMIREAHPASAAAAHRRRPHFLALPRRTGCPKPRRRAFSLIELMVAIVIISILLAILLPAVGAVRTRLRIAEVRADINAFESGITQFVGEFGQEPPSFIILYEAGERVDKSIGMPTNPSWEQDTQSSAGLTQSRTIVRQLWPQFDLTLDRDLNNDGDTDDRFVLTGDECLLFFLGGPDTITNLMDATDVPIAGGFSKNPANPFAPGGSRVGPFVEFDPSRMVDYESVIGAHATGSDPGGANDGVHSYADKFPATDVPYLYLSSWDGRGYRPNIDGNLNESADAGMPTLGAPEELGGVYLQPGDVPWKNNSYQIISAGFDGLFGVGGVWSGEDGFANTTATADDRDNVSNFDDNGTLE